MPDPAVVIYKSLKIVTPAVNDGGMALNYNFQYIDDWMESHNGLSGYSGYSGKSGYSGYSGFSGYSGKSGYSGMSGYSGTSAITMQGEWSGSYNGGSGYAIGDIVRVSELGDSIVSISPANTTNPFNGLYPLSNWMLLNIDGSSGVNGKSMQYRGEWNSSTYYMVGDVVRVSATKTCYVSNVDNNYNLYPPDNPSYWTPILYDGQDGNGGSGNGTSGYSGFSGFAVRYIGEYGQYTNYIIGDMVRVSATKTCYVSSIDNNYNYYPPDNPSYWTPILYDGQDGTGGGSGLAYTGGIGISGFQPVYDWSEITLLPKAVVNSAPVYFYVGENAGYAPLEVIGYGTNLRLSYYGLTGYHADLFCNASQQLEISTGAGAIINNGYIVATSGYRTWNGSNSEVTGLSNETFTADGYTWTITNGIITAKN